MIKVDDYYNKVTMDPNDRYKSWEHCYRFFSENRKNRPGIERFSLHLFAYLASWGMLRGSSFLLQKDYLFHNDVVEEILHPRYDSLVDLDLENLNDKQMDLILELKEKIRSIYYNKTFIIKGQKHQNTYPSDVMVSKILLGTLGCVPAYDRYFVDGMRSSELPNKNFTRKSLETMKRFYSSHKKELELAQSNINSVSSINYPMMKIIDMHFWQVGYEYDQ